MNYRKLLLVIGFVVVALLMLWGIYYVFFVWSPGEEPGEQVPAGDAGQLPGVGSGGGAAVSGGPGSLPGIGNIPGGGLPGAGIAGDQQLPEIADVASGGLTRTQVVASGVGRDPVVQIGGRGLAYYSANDGKFYRVSPDGSNKAALSQETFYSVERVIWSDDQTKAVLEYPDGANIVYDFLNQQQVTLPAGAEQFDFSADGTQLVYQYIGSNEDENWITISNADGTEAEFVQALGTRADQVEVAWSPARSVVALYRRSAGLSGEEIIPIGLNQENFKSFKVSGTRFEGMWAPRGDRMVYQVISPDTRYNPSLWTVDVYGDNIGANHYALSLVTWIDKCAFNQSGSMLYCAVPESLPDGAGIDRSIVGISVADDIYAVDLSTGLRTLLGRPVSEAGSGMQAAKLMVGSNDEMLYVWDARSQAVVSMRLK